VYLIPVDEWYIIPYEALGEKLTLHFSPSGGRQKYGKYREAWDLLQGGKISIHACVDEVEWETSHFVENENFVAVIGVE